MVCFQYSTCRAAYLCVLIFELWYTEGAKILLLPTQDGSHILDSQHLGEALVDNGHDVYQLLSSRSHQRYEKPGIQSLYFHTPDDVVMTHSDEFMNMVIDFVITENYWGYGMETSARGMRNCDLITGDSKVMSEIKRLNFDLAIYDGFPLAPCLSLIPEIAGIPRRVNFAGGIFPWDLRVPALPSFVPIGAFASPKRDGIRGLADRLLNLGVYFIGNRIFQSAYNVTLLEKYAPHVSSYGELLLQADLIIISRDHILEEVGPSMPNLLYTGSFAPRPPKELPAELDTFLQASSEGTILFSFGSMAGGLPYDTLLKFIRTFQGMKLNVVWRLSSVPEDVKSQIPANVKIMKWLPQNDILGHPKTRLFITHCGNNGQYEAAYHGVPMLGIPLFAEQPRNCHRTEEKMISLTSNIVRFTPEELKEKINVLLTDPQYARNAKRISMIMKDAPMTPSQTAVHYVEQVLKFGSAHLRSSAMDMPLYQFLMLDLLAVISVISLGLCTVAYFLGKIVIRMCLKIFGKGKEKQY